MSLFRYKFSRFSIWYKLLMRGCVEFDIYFEFSAAAGFSHFNLQTFVELSFNIQCLNVQCLFSVECKSPNAKHKWEIHPVNLCRCRWHHPTKTKFSHLRTCALLTHTERKKIKMEKSEFINNSTGWINTGVLWRTCQINFFLCFVHDVLLSYNTWICMYVYAEWALSSHTENTCF